ncbi:cytochrome-450 hydroxylase [Auriscalpium vulgare]|uniref:Cytochrome-450 hydroxylase n=1 Tax=Auriscalpium vulgare TaxID=40419 RepID=A0ACB8S5R3_9AGAM|nr:cytochrome-450 hydroxylase [Auriscalpium vulgare]
MSSWHALFSDYVATYPVSTILGALVVAYTAYLFLREPDPIFELPCPPGGYLLGGHVTTVLDPARSPHVHERYVKQHGRNICMRGVHPWEHRLLPLDPVSVGHILKHSTVYEKPWQSRRLITSLIGCGMLAAEGTVHKRQRRVATPAFSIQNMRALVPLVFNKGEDLKDKWMDMIREQTSEKGAEEGKSMKLDVCHWISRATFDVIGLAGFDYQFNAIQNESNELFLAYKEMFEVAVSQAQSLKAMFSIYLPIILTLFPDESTRAVARGQETIQRVASQLVQEKKAQIQQGEESGKAYGGKDLLSLLLKSNAATDLPESQRISDEDILHNINTFMFAGSDTTSLAVTWTLLLLAKYPDMQTRLRRELLAASRPDRTSDESILAHFNELNALTFLDNVCRESLRLVPPVHSSLRVATQDDVIPVSPGPDGMPRDAFRIRKGTFVHVPVEALNLDREIWGPDGWQFNPDRWNDLPEAAAALPGLYSNTLSFSAGPRSCIGLRFSMIEMKTFLYILLTSFVFTEAEEKVVKANVVLTRPYVKGRFTDGSQCPMIVTPYNPEDAD